jgi:hypothetical protein
MSHWTRELFRLMVKKHIERINPDSKKPPMDPDQLLHFMRIQNAAMGGQETIK